MDTKNIKKIYNIFLKYKKINTDSRKIKKNDIFFALSGENFNGNIFAKNALEKGALLAIIDDKNIFNNLKKDFSKKIILVKDTLFCLQNLAKTYRENLKIPFLGITGSNGKTTTKELIREVLSKKYNVLATEGNFNNHIGVPLTILSIKPENNFAIIEMGANHIEEIKDLAEIAKPNYGIITNIGMAHIGEFKNFDNIIKTKKELYDEVLNNNGTIFINPEDKILLEISKKFSNSKKIFYEKSKILNSKKFLELEIENQIIKTNLSGEYNTSNIQAAYTIGKFFNIQQNKITEALEKYKPNNNRSQIETTDKKNNVIWDCYNANPSSMNLSIDSFLKKDGNKILILGEMKELGIFSKKEHEKILNKLKNLNIKTFLIGKEFLKIKEDFINNKKNIFIKDLEELTKILKKEDIKNSNILIKGSNSTKLFNLQEKKII